MRAFKMGAAGFGEIGSNFGKTRHYDGHAGACEEYSQRARSAH